MDFIKVSVIVPVYNASEHLRQCLDSILAQSLTEFELICVDDGSTDNSLEILHEYESKDSRVKVLTQKNSFAGAARNNGKAQAKGKYLAFWDSDDFFAEDALLHMYTKCEEDQADLCICSASHYETDKDRITTSDGYIVKQYLPDTIPFNRMTIPDTILNVTTAHPWNKLFLRSFVEENGLDFQTTRIGNDIYFIINALCMANRITVVNEPLIIYRINQSKSLFGTLCKNPLLPVQNWIATADNLKKHDIFPARSFSNKALNSVFYFLHHIDDWNAFSTLVNFLRDGGLEQLGINDQLDADYFYVSWYQDCLTHLYHDTTEEFLTYFCNMGYEMQRNAARKSQKLRKKVSALNSKNKRLTAKNSTLHEQLVAKQERACELRDSLTRVRQKYFSLKDTHSNLNNEYKQLKSDYKQLKQNYKQQKTDYKQLKQDYKQQKTQYIMLKKELADCREALSETQNTLLTIKSSRSYRLLHKIIK